MIYRFSVFIFILAGCSMRSPIAPMDNKGMLVGTWVSKSQDERGVISRDASGRFVEKRIIHFLETNANGMLVGSGFWSVEDGKYSLRYQSISGNYGQSLLGKTIEADIISLSKTRFEFRFEDSMPVTEKKTSKISLEDIPSFKLKM